MVRQQRAWMIACVYALVIFGVAMIPGNSRIEDAPAHIGELIQNLLHIPLYGGLAFTLTRAMRSDAATLSVSAAAGVVSIGLAVGLIDEWIQSHSFGRSSSWEDLALDLVGLVAVTLSVRMMAGPGGPALGAGRHNADH